MSPQGARWRGGVVSLFLTPDTGLGVCLKGRGFSSGSDGYMTTQDSRVVGYAGPWCARAGC